jgi:hypothetical protein
MIIWAACQRRWDGRWNEREASWPRTRCHCRLDRHRGIAASINAPNTADTTNCLEIVKLLLDHGADPLLTVALLRHLIGENGTGAQGPAPAAE